MIGLLVGHYRVLDRIGRGGMGTVYRAQDEMLAREVALKVLDNDVDAPLERFRTEALALAKLSHPGIATIYQLLVHEEQLVLAMELVRGQTLQQLAGEMTVMAPRQAAEICMQVLEALAQAHKAGIVHRDLKPGNVMITETGSIKIMDFGLARFDGSARVTQAGFAMGTPAYMAPEQLLGHELDERTDLYALGVVFYRLVTGALPFRGETPFEMTQAQLYSAHVPVDEIRPGLAEWVSGVVMKALAKSPDERFQSALEFKDTLAACLAGESTPASIPSMADGITEPIPIPQAMSRSRRPMVLWLAGAAAAFAGAAVLWLSGGSNMTTTTAPIAASIPRAVEAPTTPPAAVTPKKRATPGAVGPASPTLPTLAVESAGDSMTFPKVKLLLVNGTQTSDRDVILIFANGQITMLPPTGGHPIVSVLYRSLAKATFTYAPDPRWDPQFTAPERRLDLPGILKRSRYWLVLQTKTSFAILRLDDAQWPAILDTLESRTGMPIVRAAATDKPAR